MLNERDLELIGGVVTKAMEPVREEAKRCDGATGRNERAACGRDKTSSGCRGASDRNGEAQYRC